MQKTKGVEHRSNHGQDTSPHRGPFFDIDVEAKCIGVYSLLHAECSFNCMLEADLLDSLCTLWFWYSLKNLLITADPFH